MLCDLPNKIGISIFFTLTIYFMANLRRTPSAYFTFFLFSFVCTITMSMVFRFIGSTARTFASAQVPSALLILILVIYTGFAVPVPGKFCRDDVISDPSICNSVDGRFFINMPFSLFAPVCILKALFLSR